jgi:Ser/Thr protein kinase RdoA (MazF antagonist)
MSIVTFAQKHIRNELASLAPQVQRGVYADSFVLCQRYLGSTLVFFDQNQQPIVMYKTARHKSLNHFVENAVKCAHIAQELGIECQPIYDTGTVGPRAYVVLGWVPGKPLWNSHVVKSFDDILLKDAAALITKLDLATRQESGVDLSNFKERVDWWRELAAGLAPMPQSLSQAIEGVFSNLQEWMPRLPAVLMHGDCAAVNMLRDEKGKLTLIDWEMGLPMAPPAIDMATLLLDAGLRMSGRQRSQVFRRCFMDSTPDAEICRRVMNSYAKELNIPAEALPVLLAATHIKMVVEDWHWHILHQGSSSPGESIRELAVVEEFMSSGSLASGGELKR